MYKFYFRDLKFHKYFDNNLPFDVVSQAKETFGISLFLLSFYFALNKTYLYYITLKYRRH